MKRIITCSDGTWNRPGEKDRGIVVETNVQKIFRYIADTGFFNDEEVAQLKFYDQGVGSTDDKAQNIFEGITGAGLDQNIRDAYTFIMKHYEPGDEIYLFGFSRGAYTARSVAGFIGNCGILKPEHHHHLNDAFEYYRNRGKKTSFDSDMMQAYKQTYSYTPPIKMVGVWDTVGSLGIPLGFFQRWNARRYSFHDVKLGRHIEQAYHALAIQERRKNFRPTLWERTPDADPSQVMEQVWFSGVHSNVGGGYKDAGLSDIALKWMMCKARKSGLHFRVDPPLTPNAGGELRNSAKGIYKYLGLGWRDICRSQLGNERIHHTVQLRSPSELPRMIRSVYNKFLSEDEGDLE